MMERGKIRYVYDRSFAEYFSRVVDIGWTCQWPLHPSPLACHPAPQTHSAIAFFRIISFKPNIARTEEKQLIVRNVTSLPSSVGHKSHDLLGKDGRSGEEVL